MLKNNKVIRFINALFLNKKEKRYGGCKPWQCETLNGDKGSACCKLGYTCPCLVDTCAIYKIRPINCRAFPHSSKDLKLVKNCGYYFKAVN